ncbi:bifunctional demethylmenaquinone methyltransferase/2-methoxy-6-polyprenyl-1,4-benzoquinol methylase UbiE [Chondrinema litorale]|uniref:bifunctional demethylmenaquinone methyltransferase/2-methoxy-6-polyprenyl-1,4-benzoquinol methylase UbiE n=1 Tax=Chondrinema litorale TaxID=2994555 RepID=UPI0025447F6C|nr:bifunctional demethylmenaquinone methyltransferase/2-methoxy-6-polyprenyl-1,4-benzoquinol methylase UbiE [Chondrinema litorale]UZR92549.1 bifunctional demethylmenaquinone methyltransferase/2-methoxy-6-polyprenyl-1,4-benzoquinol methylase UbiE [Chondrinema litorale]
MAVVPYKEAASGKKQQVAEMFNNISHKYDFLNHFLSMGIDIYWRKRAIKILKAEKPKTILDVATGTGDLAIEAMSIKPDKITGVDISEGMLEYGRKKLKKLKLEDKIELQLGDSENLSFKNDSFDAVMVAFGVRNFENLEKGLAEIHRVLKDNGTLVVLEFSKPIVFPYKQLYNFYFKNILPLIGKIISRDQAAYTYLPESVQEFPYGKAFTDKLDKLGYKSVKCRPLTFGISSIYVAKK